MGKVVDSAKLQDLKNSGYKGDAKVSSLISEVGNLRKGKGYLVNGRPWWVFVKNRENISMEEALVKALKNLLKGKEL